MRLLARRNRLEVRPPGWVTWWLGSHPTVYERIGTARWYARWLRARGQEPGGSGRVRRAPGEGEKTRSAGESG